MLSNLFVLLLASNVCAAAPATLDPLHLKQIELLRQIRPDDWQSFVDENGFLTPEGLRLLEKRPPLAGNGLRAKFSSPEVKFGDFTRTGQILDGIFDGTAARGGQTQAADGLVLDARVRHGSIQSFSLTDPNKGLSFEIGRLGTEQRSNITLPSPYANLTKSWEGKPNSWVDYRGIIQAAYVDLTARIYNDEPVLAPQQMSQFSSLAYDDSYRNRGILIASVLEQVGRAYPLTGPIDIGWSVTSLVKLMHQVPNIAFDESVGLRLRLPGSGVFAGLFAGAIENVSMSSNRVYQERFLDGQINKGIHTEVAPHWTAALWGPRTSVSAAQTYNKDTTVSIVEAALSSTMMGVPLALRVRQKNELGTGIEFDRRQFRLQLDAQLFESVQAFWAYELDRFRYGNAAVNSKSIIAGISVSLDDSARRTFDSYFGGDYKTETSSLRPFLPEATRVVTAAIADGLAASDRAIQLAKLIESNTTPERIDTALKDLSQSFSNLGPEVTAALMQQIGPAAQSWLTRLHDSSARPELLEQLRFDPAGANAILSQLADQQSWNAVVIAAGRQALLAGLIKSRTGSIPGTDRRFVIDSDAPAIVAAAGAINSRLSPLAPIKEGELEPSVLRKVGDKLGMPAGAVSAAAIAGRLTDAGQQAALEAFDRRVSPQIDKLVAAVGDERARIVANIFSSLPPMGTAALRAKYGPNLEGLLPSAPSADQLNAAAKQRVSTELARALGPEFSGALAREVAGATTWASDILRRDLNLATVHLMLAAEQFNRLTVDRGRKAGDLGVEMIMASFQKLDERNRSELSGRLTGLKTAAIEKYFDDERQYAARLTQLGKTQLPEMMRNPAWPEGLTVKVAESDWAPILSSYGDRAFFDMIARCAAERRASGKTEPLTVTVEYAANPGTGGASVWKDGARMGFVLNSLRDPRDADFRLRGLPAYLK